MNAARQPAESNKWLGALRWVRPVTGNGNYTFAYDFANQPVSQTGAANATFAYDGNLKRVKEVRGGKTIYTVYSKLTGSLVYRDQATDNTKTDYVNVGGAALRLKKIGAGALTPEYTHFDAQGSAIAATDASGAIAWRESYRPYGRTRIDPPANDNNTGYTGHLEDSSTGLVYMQARYYAPAIGRFYSPDPIGYQDQLNLYAYVHNDPVNSTDPTGECPWCLGAVLGGGIELGAQLLTSEGRQAYAAAGAALARGDLGGAVNAAGANVARVAISAAAGAVGQVGAGKIAQVAAANAQTISSSVRAAEATVAVTNIAGNTALGAATGAGAQATSNALTGDNGSVAAAALGGAGGGPQAL